MPRRRGRRRTPGRGRTMRAHRRRLRHHPGGRQVVSDPFAWRSRTTPTSWSPSAPRPVRPGHLPPARPPDLVPAAGDRAGRHLRTPPALLALPHRPGRPQRVRPARSSSSATRSPTASAPPSAPTAAGPTSSPAARTGLGRPRYSVVNEGISGNRRPPTARAPPSNRSGLVPLRAGRASAARASRPSSSTSASTTSCSTRGSADPDASWPACARSPSRRTPAG